MRTIRVLEKSQTGEKFRVGRKSDWGEKCQTGEKVRMGRKVRLVEKSDWEKSQTGEIFRVGEKLRLFAIRLGFKKSPRLYSTETLSSLIAVDSPHMQVCL